MTSIALWVVGLLIGMIVGLATDDVILGVIAGASFVAVSLGLLRLWTGGGTARVRHP